MEHKGKLFLFLFAVGEAGHTLQEEQEAKCRVKAALYFMVFSLLFPCNWKKWPCPLHPFCECLMYQPWTHWLLLVLQRLTWPWVSLLRACGRCIWADRCHPTLTGATPSPQESSSPALSQASWPRILCMYCSILLTRWLLHHNISPVYFAFYVYFMCHVVVYVFMSITDLLFTSSL